MKILIRYCFFILLLLHDPAVAQSFTTKVSATTIGKRDVLQVEYQADNAAMEQFVLPRFDKWTVVSGPNLSSSTIQNGNIMKQQMVYSVMIQPNATGTLTVPGATALINNKPQRSNTIIVQVKNTEHVAGSQQPGQSQQNSLFDQLPFEDEVPANQYLKKGEKAIDKIKNNIVIRLEVNKHSCYVGEPILATYKLCTRLRSKSKVVKQPQFSGCTVVELTGDEQEQHVEKINGTEYNVFIIRKVQLVPLETGKLVLPQTSVENKVTFYDAGNLSFRDLYYNPVTLPAEEQLVTLQNKPETVDVKPLPALPAVGSTDFSGAIGSFGIGINSEEKNITTNNTSHLLFTIYGEGNLQQVKTPFIKWPKGIESFEPAEQNEEDKTNFPVKGRKTFSFPFVADKKGNYTIPAVKFTYFDAAANKYVTKTTRSLVLNVAKGNKGFFSALRNTNDEEGFRNRLYIILGGALVAVLIGLVWYNGKHKPTPKPLGIVVAKEEKPGTVKKHNSSEFIFNIRELQPENNISLFYRQMCKNLEAYVNSKFNIEVSQLALYAEQHSEYKDSLQQLKSLTDSCTLGSYTPVFTIEEAMQHRLEAIEVLTQLEKESV